MGCVVNIKGVQCPFLVVGDRQKVWQCLDCWAKCPTWEEYDKRLKGIGWETFVGKSMRNFEKKYRKEVENNLNG